MKHQRTEYYCISSSIPLLIFSLPKWQRASQDPRIDRLRWWHSMLGCTTDGRMGEVRASQACRSFRRHSWRWANPVCWRRQEGRHRVIRPRSTFGATRLGQHRYDRHHWNQQQRSILVCFGSSDATKDGSYPVHQHPTLWKKCSCTRQSRRWILKSIREERKTTSQ